MPSPKKLREDSVKIALATPKLAATMTGPRMLGRMCCTAIKTLPAPRFLDATTKSLSFKDIVSEIKSNPVAIFAVIFLIIIIVASLLAPLSPYDPNKLDLANKFAAPSMQHPFGCDEYGRDYFTRALYGGRVSLMVGFAAMLVTVFIGTTIGIFSGYIGGKLDMLLMRFTDIFLALPSMLLMIVLNTILKPGMTTLILVLSLFSWALGNFF